MDCHCKDHLHGGLGRDEPCDCADHPYPTYSFVLTRVMEKDPGNGTVFISSPFMEKMGLDEGDAVEVVARKTCVIQARSHPNPWVDTRMISLDASTMGKIGGRLFGEVKIRKTICAESECITLSAPTGVTVTRTQLTNMLDETKGVVVTGHEIIRLISPRGEEMEFRVVDCEPNGICRVTRRTRIRLVDDNGEEFMGSAETTFEDVGGLDDAVAKVREVVQLPLKHPEIFRRLGIDPPRGVLFYGPSGTGKTLMARAVAGETGCYFKALSGTEIMDKHYGESEAKLRAAFEEAYKNAPAILFIDEIDALAPKRETTEGEVERRVTAQLLALMDGMEDRGDVIVLAATNLPNVLDAALRRPGRFDREIEIGIPDKTGRLRILEIHTRDMPLHNVDLEELAERCHGFVGADLRALCREAGYRALKRMLPGLEDTDEPLTEDFLDAIRVEGEDFDTALNEMRPASARSYEVDLSRAGWDHIAGYSDQIRFIEEVVLWPIQHISYLSSVGVSHLTGLLISGPSGVGKTLMARSLAKESGFNVIEIRGPELISKYLGESERNIRELFRRAREMSPAVVLLDGIDAMASSGWSDSKVIDRIVNQLVMEMNSISKDKPILVVAICNRAEDLPPQLTATGRFGTELALSLPDAADRLALFRMYLSGDAIQFQGDLERAALEAEGLSCGDIEEICRRVMLSAARTALEKQDPPPDHITLLEEDLLKTLDRWKLSA